MKLITLNTWGGRVKEPLQKFLKKYSNNIDIFCFQEVTKDFHEINEFFKQEAPTVNLFSEISQILTNHNGYFCPVYKEGYGIAMFIKKDLQTIKSGDVLTYENKKFPDPKNPDADHNRKMQWFSIKTSNKQYVIMNTHGHWKKDKLDDKNTIKQSEKILNFANSSYLPEILCGDFNLRPDTKSISMFEKTDRFINLIKTNKVKTTRTSLYKKNEKFADYIFVSPKIKVNKFEVIQEEVSDHCALFLDFK